MMDEQGWDEEMMRQKVSAAHERVRQHYRAALALRRVSVMLAHREYWHHDDHIANWDAIYILDHARRACEQNFEFNLADVRRAG